MEQMCGGRDWLAWVVNAMYRPMLAWGVKSVIPGVGDGETSWARPPHVH